MLFLINRTILKSHAYHSLGLAPQQLTRCLTELVWIIYLYVSANYHPFLISTTMILRFFICLNFRNTNIGSLWYIVLNSSLFGQQNAGETKQIQGWLLLGCCVYTPRPPVPGIVLVYLPLFYYLFIGLTYTNFLFVYYNFLTRQRKSHNTI